MRYEELDQVVLRKDLPEHGLRTGDLGTVVMVYEPDGIEYLLEILGRRPLANGVVESRLEARGHE